jgi:GNAT superfamily N-acetyltransferase
VIVRRATPADAEAMARVHWLSATAAYTRPQDFARRLAAAHAVFDEAGARPFVADDKGAIVGELILGDAELYAIYVHPDRWGTGVGQALIERAHDELEQTCREAELTCLVENTRARRFYERNGWTLNRVVTEPHFGGVPTEVAKYRKRFEARARG